MQKLTTKELILKESIKLFYKRGFINSTIKDIVNAVGVTNATVYIHFKNKEDILATIINRSGLVVFEMVQKKFEQNRDPVVRLREIIIAHICFVWKNRKEIKIYVEEQYCLSKNLQEKTRRTERKVYNLYYNTICELQAKGLLFKFEKSVITFNILSIVIMTYRWFKNSGRLSIEESAGVSADMILGGVLKKYPLPKK